jgi:hypothetical protein
LPLAHCELSGHEKVCDRESGGRVFSITSISILYFSCRIKTKRSADSSMTYSVIHRHERAEAVRHKNAERGNLKIEKSVACGITMPPLSWFHDCGSFDIGIAISLSLLAIL